MDRGEERLRSGLDLMRQKAAKGIPLSRSEPIPCKNWPHCDEEVPILRFLKGYETCLRCGSPAPTRTIAVPYNKGAYQLISEEDVKLIGRK